MDKKEMLLKQIIKKEKDIENNKFKRTIITIVGISIFFFLISFKYIKDFKSFLILVVACIIGAIFYFYINLFIFLPLFSKAYEENKDLENLKKKYKELDK